MLTSEQERLLSMLDEFLTGRQTCFLLKGYAGTGKTFMVSGLTKHLKSIGRNFRLMAPTGRAAKVISKTTGQAASTIHKAIYHMNKLKEYKTEDIDGTETYKYYFDLAINDDDARTVYIVDESSMISDVYSEGEFFRFGSGHLLRDLLDYVNLDANDHHKQLIFIGDNAQLPPVNSPISSALDFGYLRGLFGKDVTEYELTHVVRQKAESGILTNATSVRTSIANNTYCELNIDCKADDIHAIASEDILKSYIGACDGKNDDSVIIVAYSNKQVKDYNELIRSEFFPNKQIIAEEDRVLVVQNNYRYEIPLLNGDFGHVTDVGDEIETRTVSLKTRKDNKNTTVQIRLAFRNVTLCFYDINDQHHDIYCKIHEELLNSNRRDLSSDEKKALYIDFKIRHPMLRPNTPEFKETILSDPYFNCLRIKYGYAITCHKAQGGEWPNVLVDFSTTKGHFNENYFRWAYTAVTRAKKNLYAINAPHFGILSPSKLPRIKPVKAKQNVIVITRETLDSDIQFEMSEEIPFLRYCFYAIYDRIKDAGVKIEGIDHKQYCEHYHLSRDGASAVIMIDYTAKNNVSHVRYHPNCDESFREELAELLSDLQGKKIVSTEAGDESETIEITIPEGIEYLRCFYNELELKASNENLKVVKVEHPTQYHAKYVFGRGGLTVQMNYYFNGKGKLTKVFPDQAKTTSDGLLQEVMGLTQ
jgi:hypothetical protein